MKLRYLTPLAAGVLSLVMASPAVLAQPPGAYNEGEIYEEEFSERAGVDEEYTPGVDSRDYESDVAFPDEPFDYAERQYSERNEYEARYGDYGSYYGGYGYDNYYSADWFSDDSAFDTWYDVD